MFFFQATLFAVDEFSLVEFEFDNIETFRNIFMNDYVSNGRLHEIYTKEAVYKHMFYTWQRVSHALHCSIVNNIQL